MHKGYTCIGKDGEIVKVVPRELTPEEIEKRDEEIDEEEGGRSGRCCACT